MKRMLLLVNVLMCICTLTYAQGFSSLRPPTLAVMDFEVLMSEIKDLNKEFYGPLVSQSLLAALIQQNAAKEVVFASETDEGLGMPIYPLPAVKEKTASPAPPVKDKPAASSDKKPEPQRYFPPIFKIYDKKYVEMALQNNNFTSKDIYTRSVGAYAFAELDFLVLGNVYETVYMASDQKDDQKDDQKSDKQALGINVRVLNTKRAEELYSYTVVVDWGLKDLPLACSRIAQFIMRDILKHHCAQFRVFEGTDITSKALPEHQLFWQPRQIVLDDASIADSSDMHKREINADTFYWTLPGQYVLSVYNKQAQQFKTIQYSLVPGEIRHISVDESHIKIQNGSITISGILPSDSYTFEFKPQPNQERYTWEIGADQSTSKPEAFWVKFEDGQKNRGTGDIDSIKTGDAGTDLAKDEAGSNIEYNPTEGKLIITEVPPAMYLASATVQPPDGSGSVTGLWVVSSRLSMTSDTLPVDVRASKSIPIMVSDFKFPARKAQASVKFNKVTFLLQPGLYSSVILLINDYLNWTRLSWGSKEKVTVTSEYSQLDWDASSIVRYDFSVKFIHPVTGKIEPLRFYYYFDKADLEPNLDKIVVVDLVAILEKHRLEEEKRQKALTPSTTTKSTSVKTSSTTASTAPSQTRSTTATTTGTTTTSGAPTRGGMQLQAGFGLGGGALKYYEEHGSPPNEYAVSEHIGGFDFAWNLALLWPISERTGLGLGAFMHILGYDQYWVDQLNLDRDKFFGGALTGNVSVKSPDGKSTLTFDIGYGSGFCFGLGMAFMKPGSPAEFHVRLGVMTDRVYDLDEYIDYEDYPARNVSASLLLGVLVGGK